MLGNLPLTFFLLSCLCVSLQASLSLILSLSGSGLYGSDSESLFSHCDSTFSWLCFCLPDSKFLTEAFCLPCPHTCSVSVSCPHLPAFSLGPCDELFVFFCCPSQKQEKLPATAAHPPAGDVLPQVSAPRPHGARDGLKLSPSHHL